MEYWHVRWLHDDPDDPIVFYSEIGDDGYESRKVQIYRDGRRIRADEQHEGADIALGEVPVGNISDVDAQPEFEAVLVARALFESVWESASWPP
ncbi:hypothetical protein [Streptomyces sp. NPDC031705]|uniref:DUF6881 domain-containing protein n=1 Tax=Streptomyces sp. NPDC031705 TaxID=3155729 RepID=UPI0033CDE565